MSLSHVTRLYLGLRSLFGKTVRYVAVADERWLALLGWQVAALKCAARDAWISWPRVLHYQRLHLLAYILHLIIRTARPAERRMGCNCLRSQKSVNNSTPGSSCSSAVRAARPQSGSALAKALRCAQ